MKIIVSSRSLLFSQVYQHRLDLLILIFLLVEASLISFAGSQLVDPILLKDYTEDVWFGSDIERVYGNLTDRSSNYFRAKVHPLFPLLTFPVTRLIMLVANLPPAEAVRVLNAGTTALWVGTIFITLRLIGCRRLDAALLSVLMLSSAAALFWTVIPESFLFGSLTLVIALCFVALSQLKPLAPVWGVVVSALTLSITTTNWMMGMIATTVSYSWKRSLQITAAALGAVLVLWRVQYHFFPSAAFFIGNFDEETNYILLSTSGGPLRVFLAFVFHTMVMPAMRLLPNNHNQPQWPLLSVQLANPGSGGLWGIVSVGLWTALLLLGIWSCFTTRQNLKFRIALALGLLGQLLLYTVYGEETFLYAIHIVPFLIGVCAIATLTQFRRLTLTLTALLLITVSVNNSMLFGQATAFLKFTGPLRQQQSQSNVEGTILPAPLVFDQSTSQASFHPRIPANRADKGLRA